MAPCLPIWDSPCTHWLWQSPDWFSFPNASGSPPTVHPCLLPPQSTTLPAASTDLSWWECPFILSPHQAHEYICALPLWRCAAPGTFQFRLLTHLLTVLEAIRAKSQAKIKAKHRLPEPPSAFSCPGTQLPCAASEPRAIAPGLYSHAQPPPSAAPTLSQEQWKAAPARAVVQTEGQDKGKIQPNPTRAGLCHVQGQGSPAPLWVKLSPPELFLQHLIIPDQPTKPLTTPAAMNQLKTTSCSLRWAQVKLKSEQGESRWKQILRVKHK